jgi:PadR family transcriptional regulator, regulatory protein AphA
MALRHALLGLLSRGPASGYDLLKDFESSLVEVWPATQSQVYTELSKLSDEGLVSVLSAGARGRKEYAITPEGRTELRTWMTETAPIYSRRSDMLLRVFFLNTLSDEDARVYLATVRDTASAQYSLLKTIGEEITTTDAVAQNGRIALDYGLRLAELQRDWASWAMTQI